MKIPVLSSARSSRYRLGPWVFVRSARRSTCKEEIGELKLHGGADAATLPMVVDDAENLLLRSSSAHRRFLFVVVGDEPG